MKSLRTSHLLVLVLSVILVTCLIAGCTQPTTTPPTPTATATPTAVTTAATTAVPTTQAARDPNSLLIATTTSLYDTGLLNKVQDIYQNETGVTIKITSQGTGQSIQWHRGATPTFFSSTLRPRSRPSSTTDTG